MNRKNYIVSRTVLSFAMGAALILGGAHAASATVGQDPVDAEPQGEEYRATSPSQRLVGNLQASRVATPGVALPLVRQMQGSGWIARVDAHNAHKSGSEASGHVSWTLISGSLAKAQVSSTLKARTSWVTFRTMAGPVKATVAPGGGRGKAAVARYSCRNSTARDWYTYGEIFTAGGIKAWGNHSSGITSVACDGGLS